MTATEHFRRHPEDLVALLNPLNLAEGVLLALKFIEHPIAEEIELSCDVRDFRAAVDEAVEKWEEE